MRRAILALGLCLASCEQNSTIRLRVTEQTIQVNGQPATIYSLVQPDGTWGVRLNKGDEFNLELENGLPVPTSIHWHGLILPNSNDGVAYVTQYPLYPGTRYQYKFPIVQAGTFWMHSHFSFQEQLQLHAPLILQTAEDREIADKEIVVLLSDFSFRSPEEIYRELTCPKKMMSMDSPDIVEVKYDAFLANSHPLSNPEIVEVKANSRVRLRLINGASATNFFVQLGDLSGEAIAVDGNRIESLGDQFFELAVAQRIDIVLTMPENVGAHPIFFQGEGTSMRSGIVLSKKGVPLPVYSAQVDQKAGSLQNRQEALYRPLESLPHKIPDQRYVLELGGDMASYVWTINGQVWPNITPIIVEEGKRIEMTFQNKSTMAHPMHLHGHTFQVTAIDGKPINGAMRDTVLVLPGSSVAIQFDANHPGVWPLHCHVLYHREGGMMTLVRYKGYLQPL